MAEREANGQAFPADECPRPPLDHLRSTGSAPIALPLKNEGALYDRKGGDPGPVVKPFVESKTLNPECEQSLQEEDVPDIGQPEKPYRDPDEDDDFMMMQGFIRPVEPKPEEKKEEEKDKTDFTAEQEQQLSTLHEDLKIIFPSFKEDWLRRAAARVMFKDDWSPDRIVNWLIDYENLAPRNDQIIAKADKSMENDTYETMSKTLKAIKHEVNHEYEFFAGVKLTQKFPQFSIYSLRQILIDLDYMYPATVLNIVEGLDHVLRSDKRTWKEWSRHEMIWIPIKMPSDGQVRMYPLCVVKGAKYWCKKKAKMLGFPANLSREVRLVEKALVAFDRHHRDLRAKLEAEAQKKEQLQQAIAAGIAHECSICMEAYMPEEQVSCTSGHEFCVRCLEGSVRESVTGQLQLTSQGELPCITGKCEGIFPLVMLCHMLPSDSMTMLEERIWIDFLAKSGIPNLERCPQCAYAEQVDAPLEQLKLFECKNPRCLHKSCRKCRSPWKEHAGRGCAEMQVDPETALRRKYDDMMSEVTMRRCIRCKRPQLKSDGCNKLTCQCGAKMCYLCRMPIENYDHFCSHPHDPGVGCGCGKCMLFADSEKVDESLRQGLRAQLQEELLALRMKLEKASERTKMTGASAPDPKKPPDAGGQPPMAPQQRQFAAIFGGGNG